MLACLCVGLCLLHIKEGLYYLGVTFDQVADDGDWGSAHALCCGFLSHQHSVSAFAVGSSVLVLAEAVYLLLYLFVEIVELLVVAQSSV